MKPITSFEQFWPFYVREHSNAFNRQLHFIGSSCGLVCLFAGFLTLNWLFIPVGLVMGYGCAWVGHFFIEKNRPASFNYPLWSLRADWKMWALILTGRMQAEVERSVRVI